MNKSLMRLLLVSTSVLSFWKSVILTLSFILLAAHYISFFLEKDNKEKDNKKESENDENKENVFSTEKLSTVNFRFALKFIFKTLKKSQKRLFSL